MLETVRVNIYYEHQSQFAGIRATCQEQKAEGLTWGDPVLGLREGLQGHRDRGQGERLVTLTVLGV